MLLWLLFLAYEVVLFAQVVHYLYHRGTEQYDVLVLYGLFFGMQHQDTALGRMVCMQPLWELSVRSEVQLCLVRLQGYCVLCLIVRVDYKYSLILVGLHLYSCTLYWHTIG